MKDAKGESIPDAGEPALSKRRNEAEITFSFNAGRVHGPEPLGAPVQFTIEVPTEIKEIEFPFVFTNLPMP